MRVFLIRHARPLIEPGVCYGRLDVEADAAETQAAARRLAGLLAAQGGAGSEDGGGCDVGDAASGSALRIVASPARRCRPLADGVAAALGVTARYDERLLEKSFGDWEGRRWNDIDAALIDAWAADLEHFVPPAGTGADGDHQPGESVAALRARVLACAAGFGVPSAAGDSATAKTGDLAIVSHAGVMRVLLGQWLGLPLAAWSTLKLDFGTLTRVDFVADATHGGAGAGVSARKAVLHTLNG
ncbi:histidine phosphatase family protein [Rhodocyclus tenuis]|uniref:Alpha-ribazole phosphatase n=1 Tax=Rhodocyclus tenuis TaxID=1066 RepID=A0A840G3Z5_RHOTE|nr:histidine phosphatase family protein [Rhodocyclus tenuis]MBB4246625.1 alpha-ribazole phosphatase [Rhodocyclus tenuis]